MIVDLKFTSNRTIEVAPEIAIYYNDELKKNKIQLSECGSVDDPEAKMQSVIIEIDDSKEKIQDHFFKIQSLNIDNKYKTTSDFGFQLRSVIVNGTDLRYYIIDSTSFNPADPSYIENYLKSANKLHELETIGGSQVHVNKGMYANYVNLTGGWLELKFQTPLYYWIVRQNFGRQLISI